MQILFITSSRVGDAILTTGILKYLVDHYKTAKFTIACGPVAKGLFENVPGLEAIITMRKGSLNADCATSSTFCGIVALNMHRCVF